MDAFTEAGRCLQTERDTLQARIARLVERQQALPPRGPLRETPHGAEAMDLGTERKQLTNVLKMVAYHIESTF